MDDIEESWTDKQMNDYVPDRWVILEIDVSNSNSRKILSGWYGGYTQGDSWRLSSGIVDVKEYKSYYEVINHSGSIYTLYKNSEGMSSYMQDIYNSWIKQDEIKLKIVSL